MKLLLKTILIAAVSGWVGPLLTPKIGHRAGPRSAIS